MDSPYRDRLGPAPLEVPQSRGIVDELIAQFSDRFAFLRELVQNSIDAGTPHIDVELHHEADAGLVRVAVRDRGEGMDRELLEGALLVLFRSTKDRDPDKIGKFGVGFASVLAVSPRLVIVDTARAGRRWIVHLSPDLGYEIFEQGPSAHDGTTVELEVPLAVAEVPPFVQACREALARWCRHAEVPISLRVDGAAAERIDAPPGIAGALVQGLGESADGRTAAVVALLPARAGYGGFYCRGLLLHTTSQAIAPGIAFKVFDRELGHTLSRDDVRRDAAYARAMALVAQLVAEQLPQAVARELARAAVEDPERWVALFDAADHAGLPLAAAQWHLPRLTEPPGGAAIAASELPRRAWATRDGGPVAYALVRARVPVLAPAAALRLSQIERHARCAVQIAENSLTLVELAALGERAAALLARLAEDLEPVARFVPHLVLADFAGALAEAPWLAGGAKQAVAVVDARRWVLDHAVAAGNPFERRDHTLCLARRSAVVQAALDLVPDAVAEASALLCRALLLHYGKLDEDASMDLLRRAIARATAAAQEQP